MFCLGLAIHIALAKHCNCEDCEDADNPCSFDCDADHRCNGCEELAEEREEIEFEIDFATGRKLGLYGIN